MAGDEEDGKSIAVADEVNTVDCDKEDEGITCSVRTADGKQATGGTSGRARQATNVNAVVWARHSATLTGSIVPVWSICDPQGSAQQNM